MLQRRAVRGVAIKKLAQFFCLIILTSFILSGCNIPTHAPGTSGEFPSYPVAPVLREFYANLGNDRYLGPPISGSFDHNGATCQYTTNALMCMNPSETDTARRFYLEPLGKNLNVAEAPDNTAVPGDHFNVGNYHVYAAFYVVYEQMNGEIYFGNPISNLKLNEEKNRMEQYFENVGFYIQNTPDARVELLPYGYFSCASCQGPQQQRPTLALPQTALDQAVVFSNGINRLGGISIFGNPISETLTRPDGTIEQIYETVAVYATPDQAEVIRFRPLPIILGMPMHLPEPQSSENKPDYYFYPIQGKVEGYYVPIVFDEFIQLHGGKLVSGDPISNIYGLPEQEEIYGRQCFTNYCLDYMNVDQVVRIAPLGRLYLEQNQASAQATAQPPVQQATPQPPAQPSTQSAAPPAAQSAAANTAPAMQLLVSEMLPKPASNEYQTLSISVFQPGNSQPIPGVHVIATITTATGNQQTYTSAPTNENGSTIVSFPPPGGAKHGDMITYQVCITQNVGQPICQFESYLIWDLN